MPYRLIRIHRMQENPYSLEICDQASILSIMSIISKLFIIFRQVVRSYKVMSVTFISLRRDSYLLGNKKFETHQSHVNSFFNLTKHNGKKRDKMNKNCEQKSRYNS